MAALIIRIEEIRQDIGDGKESVAFSIYDGYDGELIAGDYLPGLKPLVLKTVKEALDRVFGGPVGVSEQSLEDAFRQANRYKN